MTVIDCHGHYTTAPSAHRAFRRAQLAYLCERRGPPPPPAEVSDDEIRESLEGNQLRIMNERGADVLLLSPQASSMEHHLDDTAIAVTWARACNDLIGRAAALYPSQLVGVCQLPQTPSGSMHESAQELRRCVEELGFVGCNLNPDPSGGRWSLPPLTDEYWFPVYEVMTELDVPAMVHVSTSCSPSLHTLGAHYLSADTAAFMQLLQGDLFATFPDLRLVIPHGGGAVPYHWGRFRGLAERLGRPGTLGHVLSNVYFDTCVYDQDGMDLLVRVLGADRLVFASEMLGAVRGVNPATNHGWDDTKRYVEASGLDGNELQKVFEHNAREVYPRLANSAAGDRHTHAL